MDCLIIGYNDLDFPKVVDEVKSMGDDNVAFRDLNLNFIEIDGTPYRALDVLNKYFECDDAISRRPFRNHDLLWPAIPPIATFLNCNGLSFDYINNFKVDREELKNKLLQDDILTIAITTTIYISDSPILEIVAYIRQYNKSAKIIVGGPYMSKQTEEKDDKTLQAFLKYLGADIYVFSKEGEYALFRIIEELKSTKNLNSIDNIGFLKEEKFVITDAKGEDNPLDKNPINYSLFPKEDIGEYINLKTSKSCPFECSFCAFPLRAERYVYTDEYWIKSQLDAIRDVGTVKNVFISDDTFNIPLSRFKGIMRMMITEKYSFNWHCFYRCGNSDEEAIILMKKAKCTGVFLGIESANDTILSIMNKKARRIDYANAIPLFHKHGILTFASIFVGFPGETYDSFRDTMDFINETEPDFCRPLVWYCDTTTPIWRDRDKYGIRGNSFNWAHDTMDAREACDLMEEAFMSLKAPTMYVPDPGFNFISIYYLLQRGFTIDQVKLFLLNFNNAVKAKMLFPGKRDLPINILDNLKKSCNLNVDPSQLNHNVINQYSGKAYDNSLKFWLSLFQDYQFNSRILKKGNIPHAINRDSLYFDYDIFSGLKPDYDILNLLCAYIFSIGYLEGHQVLSVIMIKENGIYFPIVVEINKNWSFDEFKTHVSMALERAMEHYLFAFHILSNPYRMKKYGQTIPTIRYAFIQTGKDSQNGFNELSTCFPNIFAEIGLSVGTIKSENDDIKGLEFSSCTEIIPGLEIVKTLIEFTNQQVKSNPKIKLSEIRYNRNFKNNDNSSQAKLQKQFKF